MTERARAPRRGVRRLHLRAAPAQGAAARGRARSCSPPSSRSSSCIEAAGVDVAIVERFDAEFARRSAEEFVREVLHARLRPEEVYVGYDFRFGHDREGSMRTLTELGPHLGFAVTIVPEVTVGGPRRELDAHPRAARGGPRRRGRRAARPSLPRARARDRGRPARANARLPDGEPRARERGAPGAGRLRRAAARARRRQGARRAARRDQRRTAPDLQGGGRGCSPRPTSSTGAATSTAGASSSPSCTTCARSGASPTSRRCAARSRRDRDAARRRLAAG